MLSLTPLLGAPASAQAPADIKSMAQQVIERLQLQAELPRGPEPRKPVLISLPPELLWVVVVVGLGILLYAFRDMIPLLRMRRGSRWSTGEDTPAAADTNAPAAAMGAADELAAAGRFADAMHVLLLQALVEIRQRLDEQFADSLTSREILRSTKLAEAGRRPLRDIVDRVEWTYFGRRTAGQADYEACRASFDALAQALHLVSPARAGA
ncbi:MAG: hypothetical protein ACJ8F3_20325 [Xanthobacteraceae bacterium]